MRQKLGVLLIVLVAAAGSAGPALADGGWGADPPPSLRGTP